MVNFKKNLSPLALLGASDLSVFVSKTDKSEAQTQNVLLK